MLKRKISKEAFEKLSDELKSEYKEKDGSFFLDTDDASELERALAREKAAREEAETKLTAVTTERDELAASAGDRNKDVRTLENQYKQKETETKRQYEERIAKLENGIKKSILDNEAMAIANEISNAPKIIYPHIRARLEADIEGETPTVRILGADGKVSATTRDDLKQEFVANKDFAAIIIGSKATGGNAPTNRPASFGNSATTDPNQTPNLAKMTPDALAAHIKATTAK